MKKVYGLTGGIACGKTTVAALLTAGGATVIDADQLARDVVAPGTDGFDEVVARFGPEVVADHGGIDRAALGAIVFADEGARHELEALLHPRIAAASFVAIADAQNSDGDPVFYDAALLVERGTWKTFAGLVVVACDPDVQLARLCARDGLSEGEARSRVAAQMPVADKVAVADWVIDNNGTPDALQERVSALLAELRA